MPPYITASPSPYMAAPGHVRTGQLRRPASLWPYAPLAAALALRLASAPTADLSYLFIAAYALCGRMHAIRALALSWLFTMISPGIAPDAAFASVGRYAVIAGAAMSMLLHGGFFRGSPRSGGLVLFTLLLGLFLVLHSVVVSPMPDVSILKALSWTAAMGTILAAWIGLSEHQRQALASELFTGLILILLLSLPLIVLPLGYLRNGSGFQGILNHPQAFGPTMALLGAWATARLFGEARPPWSSVALAGLCLFAVLISEARTAGLAMILATVLAIMIAPSFAGMSIRRMVPGLRSARLWTVLVVACLAGLVMAPKIAGIAEHYITKSGRANVESIWAAYERSRGRVMDKMFANINDHPLTGIGFGIASEPALMQVERDPILGLPVGASVEKGVALLAVVEELGVIGAFFVVLWLLRLMRGAARGGLAPFAVCLIALLLNMGEATLFSPGGFGMLPHILLGWAYASSRHQFVPTGRG